MQVKKTVRVMGKPLSLPVVCVCGAVSLTATDAATHILFRCSNGK